MVGLALDYCVAATAIDAAALGIETIIIEEATKSVAKESEEEKRLLLEKTDGIKIISLKDWELLK